MNGIGRTAFLSLVLAIAILSGKTNGQDVHGMSIYNEPDPIPAPRRPGEGEPGQSTLVERGKQAFHASCTDCHDAERSLSKSKTYGDWLETVRRMAAMDEADIPTDTLEPIAVFLTAEAVAVDGQGRGGASQDQTNAANGRQLDQGLVELGRKAFNSSCTQCHDAQRSLSKQKSFSEWMQTIRRMAAMDGAQVPPSRFRAIATYLNSQGASSGGGEADSADESVSPWSFSATTSTVWRGSTDPIENPAFFVDAWVSAQWQSNGPLSAKVTACTSCHSERNTSGGFTLELVEASATLDLLSLLDKHGTGRRRENEELSEACLFNAELKVGRFVVPFGAFSAMSHPGSYRTVTNPLIFDMGRRVDRTVRPVLMAPFSDEGVDLSLSFAASDDWVATLDLFAVNGLQGSSTGVNFNSSRRYYDNNRRPDYGGRMTLGNNQLRLGFSTMTGIISDDPLGADPVRYHMFGWDATMRGHEKWRFYFEYALRKDLAATATASDEYTLGYVVETEYQICEPLGLLARFDTLERRLTTGDDEIDRFTWGFNVSLPGGSLLLLNHEHWIQPDASDIDVVGVRWTATF